MTFAYENGSQTSTIAEKPSRVRRRTREKESIAASSTANSAVLSGHDFGDCPFERQTLQRLSTYDESCLVQRRRLNLVRALDYRPRLHRDIPNDFRSIGSQPRRTPSTLRDTLEKSQQPRCHQQRRRNQYFSVFFSVLFSLVLVGQGSRVPVANARNYRQLQRQIAAAAASNPNHHHPPFPSYSSSAASSQSSSSQSTSSSSSSAASSSSSSGNAAPPFSRQLSHPETIKVSRSRKSAPTSSSASSGGLKTTSTTTTTATTMEVTSPASTAPSPAVVRETDESDAHLTINPWIKIDALKGYKFTSLTRYGEVCPLIAPGQPSLSPPPNAADTVALEDHPTSSGETQTSGDPRETEEASAIHEERGTVPTEISSTSSRAPFFQRGSSYEKGPRVSGSNLQCLHLDENTLNDLCSGDASTTARGHQTSAPAAGGYDNNYNYNYGGGGKSKKSGDCAGAIPWNSVHLKFCSHYGLTQLVPARALNEIQRNRTLCESTLRNLISWDNTSHKLDCEFDTVIAKYDCETGYSVNSNCSFCKKAYRKWVCAMLLPYHDRNGRRLRACRSFCHLVEQRCPYFHPFYKDQYAGEPAFKCIDRNIPDLPALTNDSAYGPDGNGTCYNYCDMNPLDIDDPVLNNYCPRKERTAKEGRGEGAKATTRSPASPGPIEGGGGGAGSGAGHLDGALVEGDTTTTTVIEEARRIETGQTTTTRDPGGGGARDRGGGRTLGPTPPPPDDRDAPANHSTRRDNATTADAKPGASPSNSAATSTSTTYLLLEPWIVATGGALASLVATLLLTRPPLARTTTTTTTTNSSRRRRTLLTTLAAASATTTTRPISYSTRRRPSSGNYNLRRRRSESRRRKLHERHLVTD